jgi:hypothetical protein
MDYHKDSGHTYHSVSPDIREEYEQLVGNLDPETYLDEIKTASSNFMEAVPFALKLVERRTGKTAMADIELDTYSAEMFYMYAIEGIPRFLMRSEDGALRELNEEELEFLDFGIDLNAFLAYNALFTCLGESWGNDGPAIAMMVVLNQFAARIKLDWAFYTGKEDYLSIAEVALLAGMKEKSVRNLAAKELEAQFNPDRKMTLITTTNAKKWLEGRRKFKPSQMLTTKPAINAFLKIASEHF